MRLVAAALILSSSMASSSCVSKELDEGIQASDVTSAMTGANPAAMHCLDKGHELAEVEFGDSTRWMCVDAQSSKKCPVWKYYREECELPG